MGRLVHVIHFAGGSTNEGRGPALGIFVPELHRLVWDEEPPAIISEVRCHLRGIGIFPREIVARWYPGYYPPIGPRDPREPPALTHLFDYQAMLADLLTIGVPALDHFTSLQDVRDVAAERGTGPWLPWASVIVPLLDGLLGNVEQARAGWLAELERLDRLPEPRDPVWRNRIARAGRVLGLG